MNRRSNDGGNKNSKNNDGNTLVLVKLEGYGKTISLLWAKLTRIQIFGEYIQVPSSTVVPLEVSTKGSKQNTLFRGSSLFLPKLRPIHCLKLGYSPYVAVQKI